MFFFFIHIRGLKAEFEQSFNYKIHMSLSVFQFNTWKCQKVCGILSPKRHINKTMKNVRKTKSLLLRLTNSVLWGGGARGCHRGVLSETLVWPGFCTQLRDSLLFLPSIVSHPAGPHLLCSAAGAATIASEGSGHWGVTEGTPGVSLTGCDTLPSTINEYKRSSWHDMTA